MSTSWLTVSDCPAAALDMEDKLDFHWRRGSKMEADLYEAKMESWVPSENNLQAW